MSPAEHAYLDMKYDASTPLGLQWAGYTSVPRRVRVGSDTRRSPASARGDVLGVEAPLWSETVQSMRGRRVPRVPAADRDRRDRLVADARAELGGVPAAARRPGAAAARARGELLPRAGGALALRRDESVTSVAEGQWTLSARAAAGYHGGKRQSPSRSEPAHAQDSPARPSRRRLRCRRRAGRARVLVRPRRQPGLRRRRQQRRELHERLRRDLQRRHRRPPT